MTNQPAAQAGLRLNNQELNRVTKEALCGALLLLMREKEYAAISITELAQRAGVSRNGFYRNYNSKDEIVKDIIFSFNQDLFHAIGNPFHAEDAFAWYHQFFQVLRECIDVLEPLMAAGFRGTYLQITDEYLLNTCAPATDEARCYILAWNGAIQNITIDWIANGMQVPIEKMSALCSHLFANGIALSGEAAD